ncbi:MAG: NYN domain-containing protein [Candidatus Omnitrophota bacterium]|nr:NYN domain-containing protein [Candidatus Omnitrophota bacterium]
MIYILDAYNVIHKIPWLEAKLDEDLRSARDALSQACENLANRRGDISQIVLVFDGKSEYRDLPQTKSRKLKVVFSDTGETADERISEILKSLGYSKNTMVVSDDNSVYNHARSHKAKHMAVADFHQLLNKMTSANRVETPDKHDKHIDPKTAAQINAAYRKDLGI